MEWQEHFKNGKNLYEAGKYHDAALELRCAFEKAEAIRTTDGDIDRQMPHICLELGRVCRKLSNYEDAEQMLENALEQFKQGQPEDLVNYSQALIELGAAYSEQSKFPEAEQALQQALQMRQAHFKEPHEKIADVINNLGLCAWRKGDDQAAYRHYDRALNMYSLTEGEANKDYADALDNMGIIFQREGLLDKAEQAHRRSLTIRESCLGPGHPDVAFSLSNLSVALRRQGRNENCKELLHRAIALRQQAEGTDNRGTATLVSNLGMYHLEDGDAKEAAQCFESALAMKEKSLGADNPALLVVIKNLSVAYHCLKKTKEAEELGRRAQALMQKKIEASGDKDIETMLSLADSLKATKKDDEAKGLIHKALDVASRESGQQSLKVAHILRGLAAIEWQDSELSKNCYIRILAIEKKELGKEHAQVAKTLRSLAQCFARQSDFITTRLLESQAKVIEFRAGAEDPHVATMVKMYQRVRQLKGDKDPATINQLKLLAFTYRSAGKNTEAEAAEKEYWEARAELAGAQSMELAEELQEVGQRDYISNCYAKAIDKLNKALEIQEKILGSTHQDLAHTLEYLAKSYAALSNHELAIRAAQREISILESSRGKNHWSLKSALTQRKKLAEETGKSQEAEELEHRLNAIGPPDPIEQAAFKQKRQDRRNKQMSSAMGALVALIGGTGITQETDTTANENQDSPGPS